ncbi:MAG: FkbM family methyltransferase [Deltaproteobacteria bacterium]|nr:FkbM family methyltransferase [Deltaproteobacteria bacterium]
MTFVSFAQNHEDVMLYRALREVKQGFYIDVGAQDPVIDSVTKAFYDRGWHGINIEPNEEYFHKLQSERPHDLNLATAVGREPGRVYFYEVAHTGLSTTNAEYAQRHSEAGYHVERREVPCTTLDRICADYRVATVHFLKIDVEGSERGVLEGFSFETVRPWLVVVEATEPNADYEAFTDWEELLLGRRYRFVYFDGLNRFYAAKEHTDLARYFSRPPNFFDQYVSYQLWRTRAELDDLQAAERTALVNSLNHLLVEVQSARTEAHNLREALDERQRWLGSLERSLAERDQRLGSLHRQLGGLQQELTATKRRVRHMRSSLSWKLTSPLREVRRVALRIVGLFRRPKPPSEIATSAFASSDLAVPDEIAAGLTEPARLLYHNLRDAVAYQRRAGKKRGKPEEKRV